MNEWQELTRQMEMTKLGIVLLLLISGFQAGKTQSDTQEDEQGEDENPSREDEPEDEARTPEASPGQVGTGRSGARALQLGELLKCDFTLAGFDPDCKIEQDLNFDDFDWLPLAGSTPSSETGPRSDHTGNTNGRYWFIESSVPRAANDIARFYTTESYQQDICLTFFYHMFGKTINALNVLKRGTGEIIWTKSGQQEGQVWHEAEVTIEATSTPYQISFEGVCGTSYTGDIAIDDIVIKQGACGSIPVEGEICLYPRVDGNERVCVDPCTQMNCIDDKVCVKTRRYIGESFFYFPKCIDAQNTCQLEHSGGTRNCGPGSVPRFGYSPLSKRCVRFTYLGCDGNENNFETEEICLVACSGVPYKIPAPNCLIQHRDFGPPCGGFKNNYFYNTARHRCEVIGTRCVDISVNQHQTTTQCTQDCSGVECSLTRNIGYTGCGTNGNQRWYYDHVEYKCKSFNYRGCGGNNNNFVTQSACDTTCNGVRPELMCQEVTCNTGCSYGYQNDERGCPSCNCRPNPCSVINCNIGEKCKIAGTDMMARGACFNVNQLCTQLKAEGPCQAFENLWYYDPAARNCKTMAYGGCGGNSNQFDSVLECSNFCSGVTAGWNPWSQWTQCPRTCGTGQQTRSRTCSAGINQCVGDRTASRNCNTQSCPGWNDWSEWSECTRTCGTGQQTRTRTCAAGSNNCVGARSDTRNCNTQSCTGTDELFECNFEGNSVCGMEQVSNVQIDKFDWKVQKSQTPSKNTGPSVDHTLGNSEGYYLYIETSGPRKKDDNAIIQTPNIDKNLQTVCLSFWYHMYGSQIATLQVFLIQNNGAVVTSVWEMTGPQGNVWTKAEEITLTVNFGRFAVRFEATTGDGYLGDIAIDDIRIDRNCDGEQPTSVPVFCTFEPNCPELVNLNDDDQQWTLGSAATQSKDTGPSQDHTLKNPDGKYYFFETSSPVVSGHRAVLSTNMLENPNRLTDACVEFFYHMYGSQMGSLSVEVVTGGGVTREVFTKSGDQQDRWIQAQVTLELNSDSFKVIFVGKKGVGYRSDMALDDVTITLGAKCEDAGEDENVNCNFDVNLCGWTNNVNDDRGQWSRRQGATNLATTGPNGDHTSPAGTGTYLLMDAATTQSNGFARLRSPETSLSSSEKEACLTFWYFMYGSSVEKLEVRLEANNIVSGPIWYNGGR